jgi:hypothetical protein
MNSSPSDAYIRALDFAGGTVIHVHLGDLFILILFAVLAITIWWMAKKRN